jgi:hypothetical protein
VNALSRVLTTSSLPASTIDRVRSYPTLPYLIYVKALQIVNLVSSRPRVSKLEFFIALALVALAQSGKGMSYPIGAISPTASKRPQYRTSSRAGFTEQSSRAVSRPFYPCRHILHFPCCSPLARAAVLTRRPVDGGIPEFARLYKWHHNGYGIVSLRGRPSTRLVEATRNRGCQSRWPARVLAQSTYGIFYNNCCASYFVSFL